MMGDVLEIVAMVKEMPDPVGHDGLSGAGLLRNSLILAYVGNCCISA